MQPREEETRGMYRIAWLSILQENPRTDIRALSKLLPQGYRWLYYHDSEWLRQHLPERNRGTLADPCGIPWESKDAQLAEAVEASAFRLKSVPGQPIWITANAISKDIGKPGSLRQCLDKLPLTAKVLSEVVETNEMFAIRRIHWIGELYHQEKRCPSRMSLIVRAGVRKCAGYPKVQLTIDTVLEDLSRYGAINAEHNKKFESGNSCWRSSSCDPTLSKHTGTS